MAVSPPPPSLEPPPSPAPLLRTWGRWYALVLVALGITVLLLSLLSRAYS